MTYKTLKQGDTGESVEKLQMWLNIAIDFLEKNDPMNRRSLKVDGDFGGQTHKCVEQFQSLYGLKPDGIAGAETFDKLNELFPKQETKSLRERLECTLKSGGHKMARPPKKHYFSIQNGLSDVFHQIVDWINVEEDPFYQKVNREGIWATFCNVYAYHFFCYTWAVLPRMWWDKETFDRILEGETIEPVYSENCKEMNANALYYWLMNEGKQYFGWEQVETAQEFQKLINEGAVGVICAARKDKKRSGHITVGIPENKDYKMVNGVPLQSQAGWDNWNYHNIGWYKAPKFEAFGYFVNRQPKM